MTHEEFISLVKQPETVKAQQLDDLNELVDKYPYFAVPRLLYTKAMQLSNDIRYESNFKIASLYSPGRRWLYYYLHPEKMLSNEPYRRQDKGPASGAYFDMIKVVELQGGDTKQTLKNLAERLKSARAMVVNIRERSTKITPVENKPRSERGSNATVGNEKEIVYNDSYLFSVPEITEVNAKKLIAEKKYLEAIEILKGLNLNNPKKSVYFADQIRFLGKVIENSKK